ncbi:MAG: HDOD domain-containing protein [Aquincola sp.]|nr:HDOD domain-containing protein [Aquincola sp.]MDH5331258.1 HDOD domain-containing protein [Aquincola sp.]
MNTPATVAMPRIDRALPSLAAWASHFRSAPIPVLASTVDAVRELATNEDAVDAHILAELIGADPLMTLKLLSHIGTATRRETDVETVVGALVLMGIGPFFRRFDDLFSIEEALASVPESRHALAGLHAVLTRAHRAARFALGFAAHRLDPDAAVIHGAALLHDFAELLLWCHAPSLALQIQRRQHDAPALRSAAVQRAVLGIELVDLQQVLMKAWRLPALLVRLGDERHAGQPAVRNVLLAVRLARHTARGWDNPALPDDIAEVGSLLQLGAAPTLALLRDIDAG